MIAIPVEKVDGVIQLYTTELENYKKLIIGKLKKLKNLTDLQNNYTEHLIDFFENSNGLLSKNYYLQQKKDEFDAIYNKNSIGATPEEWKKFKDKLLAILGYSKMRRDFFPEYFQKIGIKSCVFCNSQLCVTVNSHKNKLLAKFQVDHFLNKNDYPCFSVSLFNLYPTCSSCNLKKGIHKINFELYTENIHIKKTEYKFQIKNANASIANYLLDRNLKNLEIDFVEPLPLEDFKQFDDLFSIKEIYNTQKDIAEELILKAEIYNESYKKTLIDSYPTIFNNINIANRLIIGNYCEENEIHNRPMAKFTQDIAKQLGLLE